MIVVTVFMLITCLCNVCLCLKHSSPHPHYCNVWVPVPQNPTSVQNLQDIWLAEFA